MDKPKNCTGPNIQRFREAVGLTRTALAKALREQGFIITPRRIKKIEDQTARVYVNDLVIFARFFRVRIADLFDEK